MDVKEEVLLGDHVDDHWYYKAKSNALIQILSDIPFQNIIDVGAGSGYFSRRLIEAGLCQSSVCVDPAYPKAFDQDVNGRKLSFRQSITDTEADLVVMMDVIEHVDDDIGLVRQYTDALQEKSHLVITAPAFQWLWSGHDVFLEHRRRYTLNEVRRLVEKAGLEVVQCRYFYASLLPIVIPLRLIDRLRVTSGQSKPKSSLKAHHKSVNATLYAILEIERRTLFRWNLLGGLSVFCTAKKT